MDCVWTNNAASSRSRGNHPHRSDRRSSESALETILGSGGPWNSSSD
ncbi:hypothetical protein T05_9290 [Trichinella murrelli]|uniref:Uncharacterized protein n=1 Tax=Trichinella murrelli TaxID=144512 RepID=A0A0V0SQA9_9BILA|nr:hypothetical protein T05_9290 [Trichinella murrelli]